MFKPIFANVNINRIEQLQEKAMVAWWIKAETRPLRFRDRYRHLKFLVTNYWRRKATDCSIFVCRKTYHAIYAVEQWLMSRLKTERFNIRIMETIFPSSHLCSTLLFRVTYVPLNHVPLSPHRGAAGKTVEWNFQSPNFRTKRHGAIYVIRFKMNCTLATSVRCCSRNIWVYCLFWGAVGGRAHAS